MLHIWQKLKSPDSKWRLCSVDDSGRKSPHLTSNLYRCVQHSVFRWVKSDINSKCGIRNSKEYDTVKFTIAALVCTLYSCLTHDVDVRVERACVRLWAGARVCVRVRERERDRKSERERESLTCWQKLFLLLLFLTKRTIMPLSLSLSFLGVYVYSDPTSVLTLISVIQILSFTLKCQVYLPQV